MTTADGKGLETLLYNVAGRIATVTLNRPKQHNALNLQLRQEIVRALRVAENDPDVSVILIRGAGKSFCAGYDLTEAGSDDWNDSLDAAGFVSDPNLEWTDQFARSCVRDWLTLWSLLKPVVVQAHGNCLAGGLELLSLADIAFVADDARLGYPPMRAIGTPDVPFFPWKMSMARAKYLQLTGHSISGKQAADWGWVAKDFPAAQLDEQVQRELRPLAAIDPALLAANKMALNQAYEHMGFRSHLEQAWIWHYQSTSVRSASSDFFKRARREGLAGALEWMNGPSNAEGIL